MRRENIENKREYSKRFFLLMNANSEMKIVNPVFWAKIH